MQVSNYKEQDNQWGSIVCNCDAKSLDFCDTVTNYEDNLEKCILQSKSLAENNRKHKNTNVQDYWTLHFCVLRKWISFFSGMKYQLPMTLVFGDEKTKKSAPWLRSFLHTGSFSRRSINVPINGQPHWIKLASDKCWKRTQKPFQRFFLSLSFQWEKYELRDIYITFIAVSIWCEQHTQATTKNVQRNNELFEILRTENISQFNTSEQNDSHNIVLVYSIFDVN